MDAWTFFQKHSIDCQVLVLHKTALNKFFVFPCNFFATTPKDKQDVYAIRTSKHFTDASVALTYPPAVFEC